jgi:hypothetical protein
VGHEASNSPDVGHPVPGRLNGPVVSWERTVPLELVIFTLKA